MTDDTTKYAVAIDSDGCVFDNMTLKHRKCFGPSLIEIWGLEAVATQVQSAWDHINLFSATRGVNRYLALLAFWQSYPDSELPNGLRRPDVSGMEFLVQTCASPSPDVIKARLSEADDAFLRQSLEWSEAVNRRVAALDTNLPPFAAVLPFLQGISRVASIYVVSSANAETIREEWAEAGLSVFVNDYMTQERCSKSACLSELVATGHRTLMIGDSPGDLDAARRAEADFYPIIPGNEAESWQRLLSLWEDQGVSGVCTQHTIAIHEYMSRLGL